MHGKDILIRLLIITICTRDVKIEMHNNFFLSFLLTLYMHANEIFSQTICSHVN
jgi:hypothetical protein